MLFFLGEPFSQSQLRFEQLRNLRLLGCQILFQTVSQTPFGLRHWLAIGSLGLLSQPVFFALMFAPQLEVPPNPRVTVIMLMATTRFCRRLVGWSWARLRSGESHALSPAGC